MTRRVRSGSTQKHKKMPGEATKWGEFDKIMHSKKKSLKNKPNFKQGFNYACMTSSNVVNKVTNSFNSGKNFSREHKMHVSKEIKQSNKIYSLETSNSGENQNQNVFPNLNLSPEEKNYAKETSVHLDICSEKQRKKKKRNINKIMQLETDINGNQDIEVSSNLKKKTKFNSSSDEKESEKISIQGTYSKKQKKKKIMKQNNIEVDSKSFFEDDDIVDVFNRKSENNQSCEAQINELSLKDDIQSYDSLYEASRSNDSHIQQNDMYHKKQEKKKVNAREKSKDSFAEVKKQNLSIEVPESKKERYLKKRQKRRDKLGILLLPPKVERKLYLIKRSLKENGLPPQLQKEIMRKERRRAELQFRKEFNPSKLCFHCREAGHLFADCPKKSESSKHETGICFKCGSPGHTSFKCPEKVQGFPFATCFICKEKGHITRDCPRNKHGVYPKGGKCNLCGNVNHLKKDCPSLIKQKNDEIDITLHTINKDASIDAEVVMEKEDAKKNTQRKPKIIKF